jgi:hypothetical protein
MMGGNSGGETDDACITGSASGGRCDGAVGAGEGASMFRI